MIGSLIGKNKTNWILFITKNLTLVIIGTFILSSCTAPRSVRSDRREVVVNKKPKRERGSKLEDEYDTKLNPQEYIKLLEEAKELEKSNSSSKISPDELEYATKGPVINSSTIKKPLDEQLKAIQSSQKKNAKKTSINSKKITKLEKEIERLKEKLDFLENTYASSGKQKPAFGDIEANPEEEFVILSDEDIAKQSKKKKTTKPKSRPKKKEKVVKASSRVPENTPIEEVEKLNQLSFDLVKAYMDKKDFPKALNKLKEIEERIDNIQQKSEVNYMIGESHFGMRQYQKAIQYFIKVLDNPNYGKHDVARLMIAESHLATGETGLAKENYQALMQNNPKSKFAPKARMMLQRL